jgi:hypothetical protein
MGIAWPRRAVYRVRQFLRAVTADSRPLAADERDEAQAWLPENARLLFDGMPRNDQRHSLNVLRSLRAAGHDDPALMQAALLHDVAKSAGGVRLFHRVAVVLLKIALPGWAERRAQTQAPARRDLRYPFWVHANHPRLGADMAAEAGCDPVTVTLIREHQETGRGAAMREQRSGGEFERQLTALQAADDDN